MSAPEDNPADEQRAGKCERCDGTGLRCPDDVESSGGYFDPPGPGPDDCASCGCERHEHATCPDCDGSGLDGTGAP